MGNVASELNLKHRLVSQCKLTTSFSLNKYNNMAQLRTSQLLEKGWWLRETDGLTDWLSVAKVPTSVQSDLMNHKL